MTTKWHRVRTYEFTYKVFFLKGFLGKVESMKEIEIIIERDSAIFELHICFIDISGVRFFFVVWKRAILVEGMLPFFVTVLFHPIPLFEP